MSFPPLSGRFSIWLKQYREQALDVTQKQFAGMIGCAVGSIESYEQDRILPSKEMAARIARVIDYPDVETFVIFARQGRPFRRTTRTPDLPSVPIGVSSLGLALPGAEEWPILIDEQFKHNQNRWGLGLKDDGTGFITRSMVDGAYCLMLQPKHLNGCFLGGDSAIIAPEHFYLAVEVEKVEGPPDAMAGIYFEELHDSQQIVFHARFSERVFAIASLRQGGMILPALCRGLTGLILSIPLSTDLACLLNTRSLHSSLMALRLPLRK